MGQKKELRSKKRDKDDEAMEWDKELGSNEGDNGTMKQ